VQLWKDIWEWIYRGKRIANEPRIPQYSHRMIRMILWMYPSWHSRPPCLYLEAHKVLFLFCLWLRCYVPHPSKDKPGRSPPPLHLVKGTFCFKKKFHPQKIRQKLINVVSFFHGYLLILLDLDQIDLVDLDQVDFVRFSSRWFVRFRSCWFVRFRSSWFVRFRSSWFVHIWINKLFVAYKTCVYELIP